MRIRLTLALGVALLPLMHGAVEPARRPLAREVIVLYNSAERVGLRGEGAPTAVEQVLNHLGLLARFHDLQAGLPDPALTARARAVVTLAEGDRAPAAERLALWLLERTRASQPVLILGGLPFYAEASTGAPIRRAAWRPLLEALGLRYDGEFVGNPRKLAVAFVAPAASFELPWSSKGAPLPPYVQARAMAPAQAWLSLRRLDTGAIADLVTVGPRGAVVLGRETMLDVNPLSFHLRWRLDPFRLFGQALHLAGQPRPDVTTANGRRVFYAHVDGDGFSNRALARGQPLAAEVLRDRLLSRTLLPTTVSVIARDIVGHPRETAVARSVFALPNIEAASHTYNHPHDFARGTLTPLGSFSDGDRISGVSAPEPLSPRREVDDSVRAIAALLPAGHHVELMLWSGSTNPTAPFLARVKALGLANLNGGDAVVDAVAPSVANLAPLARQVDSFVQPYASAANENLFTNLWSGPYDGQRQVLKTFLFGGAPRRLTAVDLYYHFYSGERPSSLQALTALYAWAAGQPFAYLTASRYARSVEGFYGARVTPDGPGAWQVDALGLCRTLRFDEETRTPDLAASRGIAGYNRANGALYVHTAGPSVRVALASAPQLLPHLESASAALLGWQIAQSSLVASFDAAAPVEVLLAGLPPGSPVRVKPPWRCTGETDPLGRLLLHAPAGRQRLEVRW